MNEKASKKFTGTDQADIKDNNDSITGSGGSDSEKALRKPSNDITFTSENLAVPEVHSGELTKEELEDNEHISDIVAIPEIEI